MEATTTGEVEIDPALFEGDNPFASRIVDEPWTERPDAIGVHERPGEDLFQLVRSAAAGGATRLALLVGESGAGKSHLLARLSRRVEREAFFVFVDPYVTRERLFRHVVLRLVESLWRPPAGGGPRPLERYLDEVLLRALDVFVEGDPGPLDEACRRVTEAVRSGALYRDADRAAHVPMFLEQVLGEPARLAGPDALRALSGTRTEHADLALEWLRGKELDAEELAILGVAANPSGEDQARRTIVALAALVEGAGSLVLCFDQTESLPADERGRADLGHLLAALEPLRAEARNLVLIVTCLGEVLREVERPVEPDLRATVAGLTPAAARSLVEARVRRRISPREPRFPGDPFPEAFYAALGDRTSARDVLAAAARELERRRRREDPGAPAAVDADAHWRAVWRAHEQRAAEDPPATDEVLAWSIETAARWRSGEALVPAPRGVAAAWLTAGGPVGLAVSSTRDRTAFLGEFRPLFEAFKAGTIRSALIVRRAPISAQWESAPFVLESFGRGGGLLSGLDGVSEVELRTVRRVRLAAEGGELRAPGGAVASAAEVGLGVARAGLLAQLPLFRLLERSLGA